jgi:hypothetical protein
MSEPNNEGRILLALKALQNNPKLSARRAAEMYHVHSRTLQRRRRGVQSRRDIVPNSRKLSDLEEETLVQFILKLDSQGFPPRVSFIEAMANCLLSDRNASPVGTR